MLDQGGNFYFRVRRTKVLAQNDFILYFFDALFAQENFALEVIISSLMRQVFFLISAQWAIGLILSEKILMTSIEHY